MSSITRRAFLATAAATGVAAPAGAIPLLGAALPFDWNILVDMARTRAASSYRPPEATVPAYFANMKYDGWRKIHYRPAEALWDRTAATFRAQFFHPGFLYRRPVDVFEVEGGQARPVVFEPGLFRYDDPKAAQEARGADGFAGFRLHYPLNEPDVMDELIAFLGATYFRALGRGHRYGLSARGLAINVGASSGEEFPEFRAFWLRRPKPGTPEATIFALLDSPSIAGAYRFTVTPGRETVVDIETELFTRRDIRAPGIAPLTSMYLHGPMTMPTRRDFRPAVHDSEGLAIETAGGERIWRPLGNPGALRISVYGGDSPRGFGLMQRNRSFEHYRDTEARYDLRPSVWVEPIEPFGKGRIVLYEIPSRQEYNDNIVALWQAEPWRAESRHRLSYRLNWCDGRPPATVGRVVASGVGLPGHAGARENERGAKFVVDFAGGTLKGRGIDSLRAEATIMRGKLMRPVVLQPNPAIGGWRVVLDAMPDGSEPMEIRLRLVDDKPLTETWSYQWKS